MKKLFGFFIFIISIGINQGCWFGDKVRGDGDLVTETIEISGLERLDIVGEGIMVLYERDPKIRE